MKGITHALIFLFLLSCCGAWIYGDKINLVALKKQEEKRRKNQKKKKSKLVITNDNINTIKFKNSRYTVIQMVTDTDNPDKKTPEKKSTIPDLRRTKDYWQAEKKKLVTEITSLEKKLNNQELQLNKLHAEYLRMDLPMQKTKLKTQVDELTLQMTISKNRLTSFKEKLAALHERARKAGVPPGWLR